MHTIKNFRNVTSLTYLVVALTFSGCKCSNNNDGKKPTGADSSQTDTSIKKADTSKMTPADSAATPPDHLPKKDTTVRPRPIVRKT